MSLLTKETDLLQFINQKKQESIDVSDKKIVTNYCKVITNSILKCYEKVSVDKYCIICMETINHLFWVLFMYSKNLKLTMFLCDRAILLFNEYIIMTKSNVQSLSGKENIHLTDVKSFVYKKTIGPLTLNLLHFKSNNIIKIIDICNILKISYTNFTIYFLQNNNNNYCCDNIPILTTILDDIYNNYSELLLNNITNDNNNILNIIDDFQDSESFMKLNISLKHSSLLLLMRLCILEYNNHNRINIKRYYRLILNSVENNKKNSFKKEILNIEVDEFYKLLQMSR